MTSLFIALDRASVCMSSKARQIEQRRKVSSNVIEVVGHIVYCTYASTRPRDSHDTRIHQAKEARAENAEAEAETNSFDTEHASTRSCQSAAEMVLPLVAGVAAVAGGILERDVAVECDHAKSSSRHPPAASPKLLNRDQCCRDRSRQQAAAHAS